jgi:hypothetical protein
VTLFRRKLAIAGLAALVVALAISTPTSARDLRSSPVGDVLNASCGDIENVAVGTFSFFPHGEHVTVTDNCADGWSIVVELWYCRAAEQRRTCNGDHGRASRPRLQHTCWRDKGAGSGVPGMEGQASECNFAIPEGTRITLFIAQAHHRSCRHTGDPSYGCTKNHWKKTGTAVA